MKKITATLLIVTLLAGCGQPMDVGNKTYPTYGFFNEGTKKSEKMCYEVSIGNVILSVIFVETIFAPVYFIGFDLFNPVGLKSVDGKCGIDFQ